MIHRVVLALTILAPLLGSGRATADSVVGNDPINVDVLVLNFDPLVDVSGRPTPLHQAVQWYEPRGLADRFVENVHAASGGFVQYSIAEWRDLDDIPVKIDGYDYTTAEYMENRSTGNWHSPDTADYVRMLNEHGVPNLINSGAIDEVWLFGGPYFGYWESAMAGPGAFWINGPTYPGVATDRPFAVMGFNYERGDAEMLHSLGHRTESSVSRYFGGWNIVHPQTDWDRFTANVGQTLSGDYGVGSIHYPANAHADYEYDSRLAVESTAEDWLNYPELTGETTPVSTASWGGGHLGYMQYWFSHLPKAAGLHPETGRVNNWWKYAYDWTSYRLDGTPIAIPGDTNGDGMVDLDDLNNVRNDFGLSGGTLDGDADNDGDVDLDDLNLVRNYFGVGLPSSVPEPDDMAMLALAAGLAASAWRRRRAASI